MIKAYKYRLYPTKEKREKINQTIGACRWVYNKALEVYYDNDGNVKGITSDAVKPWGDTKDELRHDLLRMLEALNKPDLELPDQDGVEGFANRA